jgi:hypothetical protein
MVSPEKMDLWVLLEQRDESQFEIKVWKAILLIDSSQYLEMPRCVDWV